MIDASWKKIDVYLKIIRHNSSQKDWETYLLDMLRMTDVLVSKSINYFECIKEYPNKAYKEGFHQIY